MKKQFVTYEIAKKLKELGFKEECFGGWEETDKGIWFHTGGAMPVTVLKAPLWQQAIDWLREKHNIDVVFVPSDTSINDSASEFWMCATVDYDVRRRNKEEAILKAIEIIKESNGNNI